MRENTEGGAGEFGCIDKACVGELIEDDRVAFSDECRDRAHSGGVAICEGEGGFSFFEPCDRFFEFVEEIEGTANEPGCGGAGAVII